MSPTISFLGATETVTGSRYLVEAEGTRLLVDCGLYQGWKKLRERNWAEPPFDASSLDAVILTHAHIDHSGYLPKLRALGFSGPVYCTPGTIDLCRILLPDSGYLQEEQARHANKWGYSKHHPAIPLYTRRDAEECLAQLTPVSYHEAFAPAGGVVARFRRAGHIVGSATVHLEVAGTTLAFTGDVGRPNDPIMKPPEPVEAAEFLVTESTYGDRRHPDDDVEALLERVVNDTVDRGGKVIVPSFAVGRTQHLLHILGSLREQRRIPDVRIVLDSPMAISATDIFDRHREEHRLSEHESDRMCGVARYIRTPDESKAIDADPDPMVVIAASGMATGGRVLHHLKRFLPDPDTTVVFVGFQAPGTRGHALANGSDEIKIHGQYIAVRAQVASVEGLSAHADHHELIAWFQRGHLAPKRVFVTHGEAAAADAFRRRLTDAFGWDAVVPDYGTKHKLD